MEHAHTQMDDTSKKNWMQPQTMTPKKVHESVCLDKTTFITCNANNKTISQSKFLMIFIPRMDIYVKNCRKRSRKLDIFVWRSK